MALNSNIKMINSTTCHCCSLEVFESIIKSRSIRLCDMRNSNDPKEVMAAGKYILNLITNRYKQTNDNKYTELGEELQKNISKFNPYVASFTSIVNKTAFKRYADDGKGIGINFHSSYFGIGIYLVNDHQDIYYVPIVYNPDDCREYAEKVIHYYICGQLAKDEAVIELLKITCMYKTKMWADEKEIRIFYIPSEKGILGEKHYFEKDDIKRSYYNLAFEMFDSENIIENIILGPDFEEKKLPYINYLLKNNGFSYVNVYRYDEAYLECSKKKIFLDIR